MYNSMGCFVSPFLKNNCFNNIPAAPRTKADEAINRVELGRDTLADEKIKAIIETGLSHMTSQDFVDASGYTFTCVDLISIGNCWAYYIRSIIPSLYIAEQV